MRTILDLDEDALTAAKHFAEKRGIALGSAVLELLRAGAQAISKNGVAVPLHGRFALLPRRDEAVTPDHVRELLARERI